jgi:hypothetical protein
MPSDTSPTDLQLLEGHVPVLRLARGERFIPMRVDPYVESCELRVPTEGGETVAVPPGELTLADLGKPWPARSFLQFVQPGERRLIPRRLRTTSVHGDAEHRLTHVGLLGRLVDAFLRLTSVFRPMVPWRTSDAAAEKAAPLQAAAGPSCYGRVVRANGWVALHYMFFYAMNDWRSTFDGVNDHEADWEQLMVYLDEDSSSPVWIAYAAHDHAGDDLRRHWNDPEVHKEGDRPVVFVGGGSHASYFSPGNYLTTVSSGSRWFVGVQRRFRRFLRLPTDVTGLGIPYIDWAAGLGDELGPGGERDLEVVPFDDADPWVGIFRGLWGLDTDDPTGGERAPAGPKFNRDGTIRAAWADPVGWAGLHKVVPPSRTDRAPDVEERELARIDEELELLIRRLRVIAHSSFSADSEEVKRVEAQITGLYLQRSRLADMTWDEERAAGDDDHHRAHLVHPATPMSPAAGVRARFRSFWAVISAPLFFVIIGMALLDLRGSALQILYGGLLWMFLIELFSRRRFLRFYLSFVLALSVLSAIAVILSLVASEANEAFAALFFLAALFTFAANVLERLSS